MGTNAINGTLTIAAMVALALLVFSLWGLRGSLVLIAFWGVAYLGFSLWHRRAQRLIRERFARMASEGRSPVFLERSRQDRSARRAGVC
jgi:hypothetical protein